MTPRRWGPETRLVIYGFIAQRDGDQCAICGARPTVKNPLDIDHIDGNPKSNKPNNLRLLCRPCNVATSNRLRPRKSHSSDPRESEKTEGRATTRIAKEDANYREGSPEMQANLLFEDTFREWLMREVATHGSYLRTAAIADGAELVDCSTITTARYVTKLTSRFGPLLEIDDPQHHRVLILKPHLQTQPEPSSATFGPRDA